MDLTAYAKSSIQMRIYSHHPPHEGRSLGNALRAGEGRRLRAEGRCLRSRAAPGPVRAAPRPLCGESAGLGQAEAG